MTWLLFLGSFLHGSLLGWSLRGWFLSPWRQVSLSEADSLVLIVLVCSLGISCLSEEDEPESLCLGKNGLVFVVFGEK